MLKFVKMCEIADLTVGFVGTMASHYENQGVPFLRSLNVKPFFISDNDIKYISEEFNETLKKSQLRKNDIIIVRTGLPGTCTVIPSEYDGCNCADVVIVHPNTEMVDPFYLAAYINYWGQKQILDNKVGSIQKHFNVHSAEEMLIALPTLDEQKKVAEVINSINGKIKNSTEKKTEIETILNLLYEHWFVQFDFPNDDGKPYKVSEGEMVWNPEIKMEIPKEWDVVNVESLLKKVQRTEKIPATAYLGKGKLPIVDQSGGMIAGYTDRTDVELSFEDGCIVFGDHTRVVKYVGFPFARGADGTQVLDSNSDRMPNTLFYQSIKAIDLPSQGYARHFKFLKDSKVIVPSRKVGQLYLKETKEMYRMYSDLELEIEELVRVRNRVLPLLMNGQAKVI